MRFPRASFSMCARWRTAALVAVLSLGAHAWAADEVNVRFSWKLKGEYAHLYLAQDKGFYAAKNLAVRMGEGAGAPAALGALLQGQEDVVVMPAIFAVSAIQKGMPIKIVALYQPKTPIVLISQPDKPVLKPKDLEGKTVAHAVGETGTSYLSAFCAVNHIDCSKVKKVQMDAQSRVPQFLQKQVDVVSVYRNNDLPIIEARMDTRFPMLDLAQNGLAIPGLAAVSSNAIIAKKPDVLKRYLAAVNEGIAATRKDPKAATAALAKAWQGGPSADVIEAQVRATMDAIETEAGKPVGWTDANTIVQALNLLKTDEAIGTPKPADVFFTNVLLTP
ncbi:ABC transporter, substrate-binding protein, aliphatic sulfonates family [Variovorax sp. SRS16]|uniref:ABC transporter substrate-binding protein n=1 Tax=Variovorax sp. SRS16 TaxID=282217 RepID=UPI0013189D93|nr:ABC transporter substrate-binding protein [Variovorax sp. SRS16]VTU28483.1 ABC transporter, substrate-binding protein, aliphatic sulfonates family [Variovorax sp. SRS16]